MSPEQYLEPAQAELGKTKAGFHPNIPTQVVKMLWNRDFMTSLLSLSPVSAQCDGWSLPSLPATHHH